MTTVSKFATVIEHPEKAHVGRKWRLGTDGTLLALDTLNEHRLFLTNVRSRFPVQVQAKLVPRSTHIISKGSRLVCLVDRLSVMRDRLVQLSTSVEVSGSGVHGPASDKIPLDELVQIFTQDFAVFAGTGSTFVCAYN
jgi:hypothetical protein